MSLLCQVLHVCQNFSSIRKSFACASVQSLANHMHHCECFLACDAIIAYRPSNQLAWQDMTSHTHTPSTCASTCNSHRRYRIQVFDALRHDFNTRRRERCVRLDFPVQQGQGSIAGLEELEQLLKAAVKASFETRAAAYEEEVCSVCHHSARATCNG